LILAASAIISPLHADDFSGDVVAWSSELEWESPPADFGYDYKTAFGSLTTFRADGRVVRVRCLLYWIETDGLVAFDLKSGYRVYAGVWVADGANRVVVRWRETARGKIVPRDPPWADLPGPVTEHVWTMNRSGRSVRTEQEELTLAPLRDPDRFLKFADRYARSVSIP